MTSWTSLPTEEAFIMLRALGRVALTNSNWVQDAGILFTLHDFEHFIENRTLPNSYQNGLLNAQGQIRGWDSVNCTCEILCHTKHTKGVYYQFNDEIAAEHATELAAVSNPTPLPSKPPLKFSCLGELT